MTEQVTRLALLASCLAVLVAGCTGEAAPQPDAATADPARDGNAASPTEAPSDTSPTYDMDDPAVADAVFLTAVADVLDGTTHQGLVDEEPGVLLATADTICDRLDGGARPDELVGEYLDALAEASARDATADDGALAGALLGAGVEVFCPQHSGLLSGEEQP